MAGSGYSRTRAPAGYVALKEVAAHIGVGGNSVPRLVKRGVIMPPDLLRGSSSFWKAERLAEITALFEQRAKELWNEQLS